MTQELYGNYWQFLKTRNEFGALKRPVVRWYPGEELNEFQRKILEFVKDAGSLLDFGAGDLALKKKFLAAGFRGEYRTCDLSSDFEYDFKGLDAVVASGRKFDAILVLEVIEHIPLAEFPAFLSKLLSVLAPGGKLVISTPNAQAINAVWSTDLTHVHQYPLADLWALLTLRGFSCQPYRVRLTQAREPIRNRIRYQLARVITNVLGVDYATGVLLLCERGATTRLPHTHHEVRSPV